MQNDAPTCNDARLTQEKPQFYLKNYETSCDRSKRVEQYNQSALSSREVWDEKRANKNRLRAPVKYLERQSVMNWTARNENTRVKDVVAHLFQVSNDSFNGRLYWNPEFRTVDKKWWRTKAGMSISGQKGSHTYATTHKLGRSGNWCWLLRNGLARLGQSPKTRIQRAQTP